MVQYYQINNILSQQSYLDDEELLELVFKNYQKEIQELEEENKALKITVDENNLLAKDYVELEEENRLLKNEIAWLKDHTKYNGITKEEYID